MIQYTVYKLFKEDCPDFYVGSTFDIKARQREHKTSCNNVNSPKYNMSLYQFIRSSGGYDSWSYEILQQFDNDIKVKDELHYIERAYIELLNPTLNHNVPMRTDKEYYQDNKEVFKQYRQDNKEHYKQYQSQYYEDNKESMKENMKQYYENNKEKRNQKVNCTCGGKYTMNHKAIHMRTRKHQNYININI